MNFINLNLLKLILLLLSSLINPGFGLEGSSDISSLAAAEGIECVNILADLKERQFVLNRYEYAETSEDLPDEFKGHLLGDGIFYFEGDNDKYNQAFLHRLGSNVVGPLFLYLKYYGRVANPRESVLYVYPAKEDLGYVKFLEPSSDNFTWFESMTEIHVDVAADEFLEFGASNLRTGDYFFVDKFALAFGHPFSLGVVKNFCWSNTKRGFRYQAPDHNYLF